MVENASPAKLELPAELLWLLDAPLFIDTVQVEAFYDAVLKPDYEGVSETLSDAITKDVTIGGKATVGASIPWFGKAEIEASASGSAGSQSGRELTITPVSNAYRHLLALALHYTGQDELRARTVIAQPGAGSKTLAGNENWLDLGFVIETPRALVFLELPERIKLMPAALELTNGEVSVLAGALAKELVGSNAPEYPGSGASEAAKDHFFKSSAEIFEDRVALRVVESAVRDHPIAWIDFNLPLNPPNDGPFLHLHIAARGQYDTGTFAYNFLTRGFNHGMRLVGTLKSGPDLNVLAVFER